MAVVKILGVPGVKLAESARTVGEALEHLGLDGNYTIKDQEGNVLDLDDAVSETTMLMVAKNTVGA